MKKTLLLFVALIECASASAFDVRSKINVLYQRPQGWNAHFSKLDVHYTHPNLKQPVMLFVHGGSWVGGDKSHAGTNSPLVKFVTQKGMVVVSINLRLQNHAQAPGTKTQDQVIDIIRALAWTKRNIRRYGGDPTRISLMGFSSGAHLVALVGTDPRYLRRIGLQPSSLDAVISFDVHAFDIPRALQLMRGSVIANKIPFIRGLFGGTVGQQLVNSPSHYVHKGEQYPPFLVVSSSQNPRAPITIGAVVSREFNERLQSVGARSVFRYYPQKSHSGLVERLTQPYDRTAADLGTFIDRVVHGGRTPKLPCRERAFHRGRYQVAARTMAAGVWGNGLRPRVIRTARFQPYDKVKATNYGGVLHYGGNYWFACPFGTLSVLAPGGPVKENMSLRESTRGKTLSQSGVQMVFGYYDSPRGYSDNRGACAFTVEVSRLYCARQ